MVEKPLEEILFHITRQEILQHCQSLPPHSVLSVGEFHLMHQTRTVWYVWEEVKDRLWIVELGGGVSCVICGPIDNPVSKLEFSGYDRGPGRKEWLEKRMREGRIYYYRGKWRIR